MSDKKVMIIDDEPDAISFVQTVLEENGFSSFVTTTKSTEAIELMLKEKPDLVVMDILMPQKSGFSVFNDMKNDAALRDIPVVMLTGISEVTGVDFEGGQKVKEYVGQKPEFFLNKPVDPELLAETAQKAVA